MQKDITAFVVQAVPATRSGKRLAWRAPYDREQFPRLNTKIVAQHFQGEGADVPRIKFEFGPVSKNRAASIRVNIVDGSTLKES